MVLKNILSSFCGSESYTFEATQVVGQNVVSYNWGTIGGDGTFSDDTDEQTSTYTPGNGTKQMVVLPFVLQLLAKEVVP